MGSAITFSGFNSIDWSAILDAIMAQERLPVVTLQQRQSALEGQKRAFATLASRLSALSSAAETLSSTSSFGGRTATSSDAAAVAASAASTASPGTYDIVVSELARAQTTASTTVLPDKDETIVASGGAVIINGVAVTVTVPATLQDLADAINANDEVGARASVVSPTPGSYQLVLTGKTTGAAGAFTVESTLSGGTGLAFTDSDGDGASGDDAADNAQSATDAVFTVNGVSISTSSNSVDDVVPGVSLQLLRKDPAATVTVSVAADQGAAKDQVKAFVSAFNELMTFARDQSRQASTGRSDTIGRDSVLRGLTNELRAALNASYATGGAYAYLSQIGLGFDRTGTLTFDETRFDQATATGNAEVMKLFEGAGGVDGAFTRLVDRITDYTDTGGLIPGASERLDDQLASLADRITLMETRLAIRREALHREFIATDNAITALNSSVQSLSTLTNQYRLF
jgi:flagellar hook-associated protein 2